MLWPATVDRPAAAGLRDATWAMMDLMAEWDAADEGRAPICPWCGVTALPAETSNVIDTGFACENADCDAFGEPVGS